jgi:hypothetical protein
MRVFADFLFPTFLGNLNTLGICGLDMSILGCRRYKFGGLLIEHVSWMPSGY